MTFKVHDGIEIDGKSLTNSGGTLTWGGVSVGSGGGVSISSNANNRVLTGDGTNAVGETNLTFDGNNLQIVGSSRGLITEKLRLGATDTSFIERDSTVNIGYRADGVHRFYTYDGSWLERAQLTDDKFHLFDGNIEIGTLGSTASGYLYLNGSTANKRAELTCTNGNLHIDADHGNAIYLNWYGSQSATSTAGVYFGNANAAQVGRIDGSGNLTLSGNVSCSTNLYLGSAYETRISSDNNGEVAINYATTSGTAATSLAIYNNTTKTISLNRDGSIAFSGTATGNGSGLTTLNASNLSSGTVAEARLPATARRDQTGSTANYGPWYSTGTYTYDATNGTRYFWLLIGTIAASDSRGMIEYEVKDDENYPMGLKGTLFFSGYNSGASFSVQHDVTTAYAVGHEPQVRLDTSRRIWMRFPSNDWASYMRFRVHKQGAFTTNTSWSTGTTRYDTAGSPSSPPNASSDILPGQNLRATSSSVTGTVPSYAHAFTSDRIKARKGFFGEKIALGTGQTDVHGTYHLYNNSLTYLNGATIIDDSLTITNGAINVGAGTTVINSSRGLTNITSANVAGNVTIDYTGNATNDAGLYIANDNNDWGIKIDKDGTATYGLQISADGAYPLQINNSSGVEKFRVDSDGDVILAGTVDGRDVAADGTKLDGISANAVNASTTALSNYMRLNASADVTNYSHIHTFYSNTSLATSSGSQSSLQCYVNGSGNDAFMTFHVGGDFACYFGLDGGTNKLSVGGWSMGANSYEIYHAGNKPSLATLGYTGATDANNYVFPYTISTGASNGTVVRRDANGYIFSNYINTTDNQVTSGVSEVMVKTSGGGDYHRSATAGAVRSFLNVADGATANSTESVGASNNTLVKRHSSGYVFANYFNTTANDVSSGVTKVMVETGNDNYIRHGDSAAIQTFINAAENGASTIHKLASNGYSQIQNWQNVAATGLYSSNVNGGHFYPNQTTSYATWATSGSRGGYDGILFDGGGDMAIMFDGSANGGFYRQASSRWVMYHHLGNNSTGFGSSTTSSSYQIYVNGAIYASGDIVGSSDERLKTEIKTIPNALDKVLKLRGVTYKWKDTTEGGTCVNNITETRMGVIAQEVVDILPEVVTHDKENDRYGVSYGHLTGVLIEAVKELKQEVNELKKELEEVKNG